MRSSGILMHISSLPSPGGIGSMGDEAYAFADFLQASGIRIWQVLPIGPTGYGESPYQSSSVFAGNPLLISCGRLRDQGLLTFSDEEEFVPADPEKVEYDAVRENKEMLLRRCYGESRERLSGQVDEFCRANPWVQDYALFTALKKHFSGQMWTKWPDKDIRFRKPDAVRRYREELADEIDYHIFCQYLFRKQWFSLKKYCNERSVLLFGDMPIYVAEDSADTWTHPDIFQLDKNLVPKRVAGVPPDYFSADGQLWGNPLYRWTYLRFSRKFDWWVDRMKGMAELYDMIRIDHFIGFANYYSIKNGMPNARKGRWVIGPGKALFRRLDQETPGIRIIAEDLGIITEEVEALRDEFHFPGMKVLQFGYGDMTDVKYIPQFYDTTNCVCYTGTHDNETTLGWYLHQSEEVKDRIRRTGNCDGSGVSLDFIRFALGSIAKYAIFPIQDLLQLDNEARMNTPGVAAANWAFRYEQWQLDEAWRKDWLKIYTKVFGR